MPVRLDKVPAQALRPARPRVWLWLGLLPLFLLLGVLGLLLFCTQPLHQLPMTIWWQLLGGALLDWWLLGFGRAVLYVGQHGVADGLELTWHLRTELGAGPLALLKLRGFKLPTQIFLSES